MKTVQEHRTQDGVSSWTLLQFLGHLANLERTLVCACIGSHHTIILSKVSRSMREILGTCKPDVHIQQKQLFYAPGIITEALKSVCTVSCVTFLQLKPWDMTNITALPLANAIGGCKQLKRVELSLGKASENAILLIVRSLTNCPLLTHLHMEWCGEAMEQCWQVLGTELLELPALESLRFSSYYLTRLHIRELTPTLAGCANLRRLDLARNSINDDGATGLAEALGTMGSLSCLELDNNSISDAGMQALCQGFLVCTTLKNLNLSSNIMQEEGMTYLKPVLSICTSMEVLNLSKNNFGRRNAKWLSESLPACTLLRVLNLSCNNLELEGVGYLAETLGRCPCLQTMDLSQNNMGRQGGEHIARLLHRCKALSELDVTWNALGPECPAQLLSALAVCTSLRLLMLGYNDIPRTRSVELEEFARTREHPLIVDCPMFVGSLRFE